jgi:hypothetical protein
MFQPRGTEKNIYLLEYERRKKDYLNAKPILDEMIRVGEVQVIERNSKKIIFRYMPIK